MNRIIAALLSAVVLTSMTEPAFAADRHGGGGGGHGGGGAVRSGGASVRSGGGSSRSYAARSAAASRRETRAQTRAANQASRQQMRTVRTQQRSALQAQRQQTRASNMAARRQLQASRAQSREALRSQRQQTRAADQASRQQLQASRLQHRQALQSQRQETRAANLASRQQRQATRTQQRQETRASNLAARQQRQSARAANRANLTAQRQATRASNVAARQQFRADQAASRRFARGLNGYTDNPRFRNRAYARNRLANSYYGRYRGDWGRWHNHGWWGSHWNHWGHNSWWAPVSFFSLGLFFGDRYGWYDEPIYYDYGPGGTVYYEGPYAYIGSTPVATREVWIDRAYELADVEPSDVLSTDLAENWKPLGLFMLVRDDDARQSTPLYLQLAISKNGEIGGTYHNDAKNSTLPVAGRLDATTQRVAFHVGGDKSTVVETGLYNLTQDTSPAQIHFGRDHSENWLLIRLKDQSGGGGR